MANSAQRFRNSGILAFETHGLLIAEGVNPEVLTTIREMVGRYGVIEHVNEVATMHVGPEYLLVNLSVDFSSTASADDVESVVRQLDRELKASLPRIKRVFIEAEARRPAGSSAGPDPSLDHASG